MVMLLRPQPGTMPVLCPEFGRHGRLWLPLRWLEPTAGRQQWEQGVGPVVRSLCLLRLRGRCHWDQRCNQVHVTADQLEPLRAVLRCLWDADTCCLRHGDPASCARAAAAAHVVPRTPVQLLHEHNTVAPDEFAATAFWTWRSEQTTLRPDDVCRLHAAGRCRFGPDCRRAHVCRRRRVLLIP